MSSDISNKKIWWVIAGLGVVLVLFGVATVVSVVPTTSKTSSENGIFISTSLNDSISGQKFKVSSIFNGLKTVCEVSTSEAFQPCDDKYCSESGHEMSFEIDDHCIYVTETAPKDSEISTVNKL